MKVGITIQNNPAGSLPWLQGFYEECRYGGEYNLEDSVWYASDNGQPVAVGRISSEHEVLVLRGMQVKKSCRGEGIGRALLKAIADSLGTSVCYCLPYRHLGRFYSLAGFLVIADEQLPSFLAQRKQKYIAQGLDVIAMLYPKRA